MENKLLSVMAMFAGLMPPDIVRHRKIDPAIEIYRGLTASQLSAVRGWDHSRFDGETAHDYELRMRLRKIANKNHKRRY